MKLVMVELTDMYEDPVLCIVDNIAFISLNSNKEVKIETVSGDSFEVQGTYTEVVEKINSAIKGAEK